jgi:hypothetical protein
MASSKKKHDRDVAANSPGNLPAEKVSEPVIAPNGVPLPPVSKPQGAQEPPSAAQLSNIKPTSEDAKGAGKSSGGKSGSGKTVSRGPLSSAGVGDKPKKKSPKSAFTTKGNCARELEYRKPNKRKPADRKRGRAK